MPRPSPTGARKRPSPRGSPRKKISPAARRKASPAARRKTLSPSLQATLATLPPGRHYKRAGLLRNIALQKSPRGSATRGWNATAPQRGRERKELAAACGTNACFLRPADLGYPVCPALRTTGGACAVDCRGVQSAYNRARQHHHDVVAQKALRLRSEVCSSGQGRSSASPRSHRAK